MHEYSYQFIVQGIIEWFYNMSDWTEDMVDSRDSALKLVLDFADDTETDLGEFDLDILVDEVYSRLRYV